MNRPLGSARCVRSGNPCRPAFLKNISRQSLEPNPKAMQTHETLPCRDVLNYHSILLPFCTQSVKLIQGHSVYNASIHVYTLWLLLSGARVISIFVLRWLKRCVFNHVAIIDNYVRCDAMKLLIAALHYPYHLISNWWSPPHVLQICQDWRWNINKLVTQDTPWWHSKEI